MTVFTLLGAGLILALVVGVSYVRARRLLEAELRARAEQTALATTNSIDTIHACVEKIVLGNTLVLEHRMPDVPELYRMLKETVRANPEVLGAAIALEPTRGPAGPTGYVAPYAYRSSGSIATKDLGEGDYAYDTWDWFTQPRKSANPVWSEPYFDVGGGDALMVTYSAPIFTDGDPNRFVAVATADISLEWLTDLLARLRLGSGYAFVISRTGAFVSHPMHDLIMNETIFTLADREQDQSMRDVGRRMLEGETGFVRYRSPMTGEPGWLAFAPLRRSGGSLGLVFTQSDIMAEVITLSRASVGYGAVGVLLLALIIRLIALSITRPIQRLETATQTLGSGDLDTSLPACPGDDEISRLTRAFETMRTSLKEHIEQLRETTAARERIEGELQTARSIQMSLVPKTFPPFPERAEFDLYALLEPAREIGGDYYDFFMPDDDHLCLAVCDVSGKGMPAALFMAVTRTLLRGLHEPGIGPSTWLSRLNDALAQDNDAAMFVTVFLAVIDLRDGTCTYARGGHNPPLVLRANGAVETLPTIDGPVVGVMEMAEFAEASVVIKPGDTLFVYTDGVTEAMNVADEMFGMARTAAEVCRVADRSGEQLISDVRAAIERYAGGAPQSDDITMLAFRLLAAHEIPDSL